jgi:hypothetical protein
VSVEISRIQHCDHENCTLGQLQVTCPYCQDEFDTCDNWYAHEEAKVGDVLEFTCSDCKRTFEVQLFIGHWECVT